MKTIIKAFILFILAASCCFGQNALRQQDVLLNEAVADSKQGALDQALAKLRECLNIDPGNREAIFVLGIVYYKKQEYDNARDAFIKSTQISPVKPMAYYFLGLITELKIAAESNGEQKLRLKEQALNYWNEYLKAASTKHPDKKKTAKKHADDLKRDLKQ